MSKIHDMQELDEKSAPSDKFNNRLTLILSLISVALMLTCAIIGLVDRAIAVSVFKILFFPFALITLVSIYLGIFQLVRNPFAMAFIAIIIDAITVAVVVAFIIFAYAYTGNVHLPLVK